MSNLVKQLREEAECYRGKTHSCLIDAAERIEQLEKALRFYAEYVPTFSEQEFRAVARAALREQHG